MKALLLAAGFGKRLRPITKSLPKCLVPVGGRPLLDIWIEQLVRMGVVEILVNTHYLHQMVEAFVRQSRYRKYIELVHEDSLHGTGATIQNALSFWGEGDLFVAHADNLCLCDFSGFRDAHAITTKEILGTMMLFETDTPQSCGIVEVDSFGRLMRFHEKVDHPPSNLANAAVYIFAQEAQSIFSRLKPNENDLSLHVVPKLIGKLNTWINTGYMRDIGTAASLELANRHIAQGVLSV